AVFPDLTVAEDVQVAWIPWAQRTLSLATRAAGLERERAEALLERVGLGDQASRRAAVLPYGDLKKLEVAIALAGDPELLLLDEPTAGMAPAERRGPVALGGAGGPAAPAAA